MALSNTEYGKAYEYACLSSIKEHLSNKTSGAITIQESDAYHTAQSAFAKAEIKAAFVVSFFLSFAISATS